MNKHGLLAWTVYNYDNIYVRRAQFASGEPATVPDIIHARFSLAWSHSGHEFAFINGERNDARRTICIWNRQSGQTRFTLPWIGKPNYLAWSPDDRFIAFDLEEASGLFVVDTRPQNGDPAVSSICRIAPEGGVLKCGAWHP
jgi:hypothetical protein